VSGQLLLGLDGGGTETECAPAAPEMGGEELSIVLSGSILTKGRHSALNDAICAQVIERYPRGQVVVVDKPPEEGAVRIARGLLAGAQGGPRTPSSP
jgi:hypothetical protein